jgi:predicted KAP-like P-loop ATPase
MNTQNSFLSLYCLAQNWTYDTKDWMHERLLNLKHFNCPSKNLTEDTNDTVKWIHKTLLKLNNLISSQPIQNIPMQNHVNTETLSILYKLTLGFYLNFLRSSLI